MDPNIATDPLMLAICMLGVFVATTTAVMVLTTPYDSPAKRLARYARFAGRATSPGAAVDELSLQDRVISPLFKSIIEFAARAAPARARKTAASELIMAGSRMNPTVFLGLQTLLMFGVPGLSVVYIVSRGAFDATGLVVL